MNWSRWKGHMVAILIGLGILLILIPQAGALSWFSQPSPTGNVLYDVAYGGGQFVAVGSGGSILTSPSGGAWTAQSSGTTTILNGVASANGGGPPGSAEWVVVGHNGTVLYSPAAAATSWLPVPAGGLPPGLGTTLLEQITHGGPAGGKQYVAVGWGGTIITSPGGLTWSQPSSGTAANLADVEYGGGQFVVAGWNGTILTSPNGSTWTVQSSGTSANLYDLAYGSGTWVAVGAGGTILYSANGVAWSAASGTGLDLYDVIFDGCRFVASGAGGTILTSPDGINWTPDSSGVSASLFGLASGNGVDVAVGTGGTVLVAKGCQPSSSACAPLPAGAVAWWPLNETAGATTVADSVGGYTGTPSTMPGVPAAVGSLLGPKAVAGMVGGALLFDRDDWVQVPNSPALNFAGPFTVDAWVYAPPQSAAQFQAIVDKVQAVTGAPTGLIGYRLYVKNGNIHFELSDGATVATVAAPAWFPYGTWVFVAAERTANSLDIYVNGTLAATAALPAGFGSVSNSADLLLGQITTAGSPPAPNPTDGWIALDEVEIFSQAVSPQDLQAIYQAGPKGKCPPGAPDLAITKVQQGPAVVGMSVYYQVYVANVGTAPMPGPIMVTDHLPAGVVLQAAGGPAGSGWACSPAPPPPVPGPVTVTCTHPGPVPAGGSLPPITIQAKVTGKLTKPGSLTNCASVAGPNAPGTTLPLDQNPANDKACVTSPVGLPGAICGIKWLDTNGNGVHDPGEPGLSGWTIEIRDAAGNLVATVVTGKGGRYCIKKLVPGTYTVGEILQPGWIQTAPQPVPPGTHTVTVASGQTVTGIDFGNRFDLTSWPGWPGTGGQGGTPGPGFPGIPDLAIQKTAIHVVTGSYIQYAITVTNVGTAPMPMPFTITDTIPWAGSLFCGATSGAGYNFTCAVTGQTVTWTFNSWPPNGPWIMPGQSITAYVSAFFAWPPPPAGKKVKNCASVSGVTIPGTGIPLDMNAANNHVCVQTTLP